MPFLREERLLICGEVYCGAAGPAQGPAGCPADLPSVLQGGGKSGAGGICPLPGAVDVSRWSRVTAEIGKCSVCGIVKAEWIDREAGVNSASIVTGEG